MSKEIGTMKRKMKLLRWCAPVALVIGLGSLAARASDIVVVPATTDIWLAGQPSGVSVTGYFGSDSAPANSPALVNVTGGEILTFTSTGSTSVDDVNFGGPDGDPAHYPDQSTFSPSPADGAYNGPADALLGVFLNSSAGTLAIDSNGVPTGFVAGLDYQTNGNEGLDAYSPALNQIFFIGDGLTGTGTGTVQQFTVPAGATGLYLAAADSVGGSTGNEGSISVDVSGANTVTPEPGTLLLLGSGLVGLAGMVRRKIGIRG
jgi:hypothetical protein